MATLNSLLTSLQRSANKSSGWGSSSSTWGGHPSSYIHLPKAGKKLTESQAIANKIMSGAKEKASHSHESALGSILGGIGDTTGNLVSDIVDTAENVPSGLLKIATTNPVDTAKAIGADYKTRYGSLFSGDFGKFAHQVGQHPLSYLLDVGTIATGGAGALAKAGMLSKDLETVGLSANRVAVKAGEESPGSMDFFSSTGYKKVPVNVSRNPATRQVQKGVYSLQARLPASIPVIGEEATAKRALANQFQLESHGMDAGAIKLLRDKYRKQYGEAADEAITKFHHVVGSGGALGKSTQIWKDFTLAGRPGFQVTNLGGNTIMFHGANGIGAASKGMQLAAKGELDKSYNRFFGGASDTYGSTEATKGNSWWRKGVNKSYGLQGKAETLNRKGTMYAKVMKTPELKALVREGEGKGLSTGEAVTEAMDKAFQGEHGMALRREVRQKIDDTMGDYTHYSAAEQRLKQIVPFYGWNRHASRYLYATARDRPGQLLALNQISKIGEAAHKQWGWEGTPDFMKEYLKIGGHTFDAHGLNPLAGGTDALKSAKDLVSGDVAASAGDLGSNLNPFVANTIQGLTGTSLLTGAPVAKNRFGLLGSVAEQTALGLPQVRVGQQLLKGHIPGQGEDKSNPHTFLTATGRLKAKFKDPDTGEIKLGKDGLPQAATGRHMQEATNQSIIVSFLGIPDRGRVNQKVAQSVQKSIDTKAHPNTFRAPKKRKKKASFKSVTSTQSSSGWGASTSNWGG